MSEFEGEDFEDMPLDTKISAMEYAMDLVVKAIGTDDVSHQRLKEYRAQWVIRGAYERMRRTGINPLTGQPIDPDTMPDVNHVKREPAARESPDWWERSKTLCEWHKTDTFRHMYESLRDVPGLSNNTREWLADGGVDLARAAQMTDVELLRVSRVGKVTVDKLRRFFAEREQREEATR